MKKEIDSVAVEPVREKTLEGWLDDHLHEIREAQDFSVDDLPHEPASLAEHLSLAQSLYPRMGFLLADAESFVLKAHAVSVMKVRGEFQDYTAEERKVISKSEPNYLAVVKLRDDLAVITQALKNKCFSIMNTRNNTMDRTMQSGSDSM